MSDDEKEKKRKDIGSSGLLFGKGSNDSFDDGKVKKKKKRKKGKKKKKSGSEKDKKKRKKRKSSDDNDYKKKKKKRKKDSDEEEEDGEEESPKTEDSDSDDEKTKGSDSHKEKSLSDMSYKERREMRRKKRKNLTVQTRDTKKDTPQSKVDSRESKQPPKKAKVRHERSKSVSTGGFRSRYKTLGRMRIDDSIKSSKDEDPRSSNNKSDSNWKGFFTPSTGEEKKGVNKRRRSQSVSRARPSIRRQDSLSGSIRSMFGFLGGSKTPKKSETPVSPEEAIWLNPTKMVGSWDGYEIHRVCFEGQVMDLFKIVKNNKDLNALNEDQNTALHFSCAHNKILCVKELLKHADVNTHFPNCLGDTPLHIASKKGHADIVKQMIRFGRCNMYETNRDRRTCIDTASNEATRKVFQAQIDTERKFLTAVHKKKFRVVKRMLKEPGVNVNCTKEFEIGSAESKKKIKRNALDILFSTKRLSELDDHENLIRLLINRGCNVRKKIMAYECRYSEMLNEGYLRQKRYHYLREILQTEKTYNDDLWITLRLFYEPLKDKSGNDKTSKILKNIKKKEMRDKLVTFWETLEEIQKVALKTSMDLSKKFKQFANLLKKMDGVEGEARADELEEAEMKYMEVLRKFNIEPYIKFCYHQSLMEEWIKKKKEFHELYKFYRRQEQKIPLPRIRDGGFVSMLSKIRNRLFKYRGFLECVIKYTDDTRSDSYMELLRSCLKHVMDGLAKINKDAGDIENKKQMLSIHRLFKERYNLKMLIQNKNRKYICHETSFKAFNMENLEVHDCDIYVFSDSIFFGSKKAGGFEFYWYNTKKIIFDWHEDHYRLQIFAKREDGGKKLLDYMVPCSYSYAWFKEMKEFFSAHHPSFYWNHIFLHSAFKNDKEVEDFRKLRSEEDEVKIQLRMMNLYKRKRDHMKEKLAIYTNRVVEKKRNIDKLRRLKKKSSPRSSGKSKKHGVVKKVDLKVKISFDRNAKKKVTPRRLENPGRIHTPDEETPVKVVFPSDVVFDSAGVAAGPTAGIFGGEEQPESPREGNETSSTFRSNEFARRLFNTPNRKEEEDGEEEEEEESDSD